MFIRSELKSLAKEVLASKYFKLLLVSIALTFCMNGVQSAVKFQINYNSSANFNWAESINFTFLNNQFNLQSVILLLAPILLMLIVCGLIVSILFRVFLLNPLEVGFKDYFCKASADEERVQDVLNVFTEGSLKTVAWTMFRRDLEIVLFTFLFIIPGILRAYSYRFVPYLLADNPDMTTDEVLEMSKMMTKGIRFDIFVLDISYCLWYIPGWFTGGLTNFLVKPYVYQTEAQLYLKMKDEVRTYDEEY